MDRKLRFAFLAFAIITLFLVSSIVALADPMADLGKSIGNALTTNIQLPQFAFNSSPIKVPIYLVLALWIMLFAVIFSISKQYLPFFKDQQSQGPAIIFSLAFSAMAVFGTDLIYLMFSLLSDTVWYGYWLVVLAIWFFGIILIYLILGKGTLLASKADTDLTTARQQFAANDQVKLASQKIRQDDKVERATLKDEDKALDDLRDDSLKALRQQRNLRAHLIALKEWLPKVQALGDSQAVKDAQHRLERQFSALLPSVSRDSNLEKQRRNALAHLVKDISLNRAYYTNEADAMKELNIYAAAKGGTMNNAAAKRYFDETKSIYDSMDPVVQNLNQFEHTIDDVETKLERTMGRLRDSLHQGNWPQAINDVDAGISVLNERDLLLPRIIEEENKLKAILTQLNGREPTIDLLRQAGYKIP